MPAMKRNNTFNSTELSIKLSDEFLDETIRVWQPRCPDKKLTREDAREITTNMVGFFKVLMEWDREGKLKQQAAEELPKTGT